MNELFIMLFIVMILINVGTLISIGLLLNFERQAILNFRTLMVQYSRDLDMCDFIRKSVVYEETQIFFYINQIDPKYNAFKHWLENNDNR